jgi:potassium efflux system protein
VSVLRLFLIPLVTVLLCLGEPAFAQTTNDAAATENPAQTQTDDALWESVASRAEVAIEEGNDPNEVFETLRERLVGFRSAFDTARKADSERIATLRSQIEALGPAPEEGETEAEDISQRRTQLNRQLKELLSPVQVAEEAYTRADGLIREIDAIIRERQTERLLSLSPSPLNPVLWPTAVEESAAALGEIWTELSRLGEPGHLSRARDNLPLVLVLLVMAMMLLIRGRTWATVLGDRLRRIGGRGSGVWSFVVSLLRIGLPLAGLYALTEAIYVSGLVGVRTSAILDALPVWGIFLLGFRWLSEQLFSRNDDDAILPMSPGRRSWARFYITVMALLMVVQGAIALVLSLSDVTRASQSVILFPLLVTLSLFLHRFGRLLRTYEPQGDIDGEAAGGGVGGITRILRWSGLIAQIVSLAAPVMSAVGYAAFGAAILYPTILSMALLGFVMALQRFASDVYGLLSGKGQAARDSLLAVLIALILVICSGPLLALIWGARVADLTELWTAFLRGFQVGGTRISPTDFITVGLVFAAGFVLTRLLQTALRTSVLPKTSIDIGGQNALVSGVGYIGLFLAALIAVTAAGIDLSSIAIVAGALSVGIGFGLQNIVSNFISGIILLIERPISEGDWIEVGGQHGYVRDISVRSTRIETFDRTDVIVPNSDLVSGTVTNYTRGNTVGRVIVPVGVAYGTDTRKVEKILKDVAKAHPLVLMNPEPFIVFQGFGASSLDFEIRAILRDVNWVMVVKSEMNHEIAKRFAEEGIEIPFPQQDIWLRNAEAIRRGRHDPGAPAEEEADSDGATDVPERVEE